MFQGEHYVNKRYCPSWYTIVTHPSGLILQQNYLSVKDVSMFGVAQSTKMQQDCSLLTLLSGGSVSLKSSTMRMMSSVAMVREKRAGY